MMRLYMFGLTVVVTRGLVPFQPVFQRKEMSIRSPLEVRESFVVMRATTEEVKVPDPVTASSPEEEEKALPLIEKSDLISEVNADYEPLMMALQTQNFEEADQITRDILIQIAGQAAQTRGYVYWTEAQRLPLKDLITIEQLWNFYSDSKFGYTVQKDVWRRTKGVFDEFCRKLGWTTDDADTGLERKRRWFGKSEFDYSMQAPKGHLPLTSALRGTQLLKALIQHSTWESEEWLNRSPLTARSSE